MKLDMEISDYGTVCGNAVVRRADEGKKKAKSLLVPENKTRAVSAILSKSSSVGGRLRATSLLLYERGAVFTWYSVYHLFYCGL